MACALTEAEARALAVATPEGFDVLAGTGGGGSGCRGRGRVRERAARGLEDLAEGTDLRLALVASALQHHRRGPLALAAELVLAATATGLFVGPLGFALGVDRAVARAVAGPMATNR